LYSNKEDILNAIDNNIKTINDELSDIFLNDNIQSFEVKIFNDY
jgi:uncharacterized protein (UPF0335 family)